MNDVNYNLSKEEIVLIEKFREEQEAVDRKVKYFNFLSRQEDFENKIEFISIRTSLFKFLTKVFSIYYRWCNDHDICYFCSLNMMIQTAYKESLSKENIDSKPSNLNQCSKRLHQNQSKSIKSSKS